MPASQFHLMMKTEVVAGLRYQHIRSPNHNDCDLSPFHQSESQQFCLECKIKFNLKIEG
jgi:hypothetical protein